MANPWFRLYSEFASDHKIQMMSEADQRRFVMLLCLRCSNGDVTLQDNEIAFQLRVTPEEWVHTKSVFLARNLIDEDNKIVAWDRRQFVSDSSAARVAKHREKVKQARNVTVTPPDTDTDTDADTEKPVKARATRKCPAGFVVDDKMRAWAKQHAPSVNLELSTAAFLDHTFKNAISDWVGAWRNWLRRDQQYVAEKKGGRFPLQTAISKPDFSGLEEHEDGHGFKF